MSSLLITIGRLRVDGEDALRNYATGVMPLIHAAGGEIVARANPTESVVGDADNRPDLVAVMRFPSAEGIRQFLASEEYRRNLAYRDRAFAQIHSYIAEDLMA